MTTVAVYNLYKSYGDQPAVVDLSFSIEPGEILGLIGPNGAGKSSTIKMILDFMRPDAGKVKVFGQPMSEEAKNRIGYLPEERGLYQKLTAMEVILYLASLKGMGRAAAEKRALELLEKTGMLESSKKKIKHMSKGMGQMIQFIVTIIHEPELLIMDEPFSGLDPVNTERLKKMIEDLQDEGRAIILSTHQMHHVEELCNRVLMINRGSKVLYGDLREIRARFREHSIRVNAAGEIGDVPGVVEKRVRQDYVELVLEPDTTPQMVLDRLRESGVIINRFEVTTPSLHNIFLHLAGGNDE